MLARVSYFKPDQSSHHFRVREYRKAQGNSGRSPLVIFAAGKLSWRLTALRLKRQAIKSGSFSRVLLLEPTGRSNDRRSRETRGFDFWTWKPRVVLFAMGHLRPSERGVWYVDAGCSIFESHEATARIRRYEDFGIENGVGAFFQLPHPFIDGRYSKAQLVRFLDASAADLNQGQIQATAFFVARSSGGKELIESWCHLANLVWPFDDSSNYGLEMFPDFVDHRHDQAVLSLLIKKRNVQVLPDDLYMSRNELLAKLRVGEELPPILATRHRSYFSDLRMNPISRFVRLIQQML